MESPDPEVWVRALGKMSGYFDDPESHPWVPTVLKLYLTEPAALQNPARTRKILRDSVMIEAKTPCEDILLDLLGDLEYPFLADVKLSLTDVAADSIRRRGLLERLQQTRGGIALFQGLFEIISRHDPQAALATTMERLKLPPEEDPDQKQVVDTVGDFLGTEWEDAKAALRWWEENRRLALPDYLRQRDRKAAVEEAVQIFRRSAKLLHSHDNTYREFLLASLQVGSEEVRAEAVREVQDRLVEVFDGQRALLEPVVELLLQLALSSESSPALRLKSLNALGQFQGFGDFEPLRDALAQWIAVFLEKLPPGPRSELLQMGWAAVEAAGKLEAALGKEIEAALAEQLDDDEGVATWPAHRDDLVLTLLESLRSIGPGPDTLSLMQRIFDSSVPGDNGQQQKRVASHELAVQVMGKWSKGTNERANEQVLKFMERALDRRDEAETRTWAIIGLGYLQMPEGISALEGVIEEGGTDSDRTQAVRSIYNIGQVPAVASFRALLERLPAEDEAIRNAIDQSARDLCTRDRTLRLLQEFVLPKSEPTAWFGQVIDDRDLAALVDPLQIGPDALGEDDVFACWHDLRLAICAEWLRRAEGNAGEEEAKLYRKLADSANQVLGFLADHEELKQAVNVEFNAVEFEQFRAIGARGPIVAALTAKDFEALGAALKAQLAAVDAKERSGHVLWTLQRLEKLAQSETTLTVPAEFLTGLDSILGPEQKLTLGEEAERIRQALLKQPNQVVESNSSIPDPGADEDGS